MIVLIKKYVPGNTFSTCWNVTTAQIILKDQDDIDALCLTNSFENKILWKIWFSKLTLQHVYQSVSFCSAENGLYIETGPIFCHAWRVTLPHKKAGNVDLGLMELHHNDYDINTASFPWIHEL